MNTNLLKENFQKSLIDHAMLADQWKNVNLQPPKISVWKERERIPSKVYIPLRGLDNGQVIPNQNCFEKKPMWRQGTTCVNQHLRWYHGQTVKPVLTKWLWYGFTSYTLHSSWLITEKMAGRQQASKSRLSIANLRGLKIGQEPEEEEP
jgi:hypothetical protein